jgi:DNA-directed RNA polymerase II subunit RPB1
MFHIGFIAEVYKVLQCICFRCSKLRITDEAVRGELMRLKNGKRRLAECLLRSKTISRCGQGPLSEGCNFHQVPLCA